MLGGRTTPYFHSPDPQAFNLRVNELAYAAGAAGVPDAGSSALLLIIAGAGLLALRRR
jgi:hypothetical protein